MWASPPNSDNNRFLAAINDGMDDPVVSGIGGAAAFYSAVATALRAAPLSTSRFHFVRRVEFHSTPNIGRPRPGSVRILDDRGTNFLTVVNRVDFVPSGVARMS